MKTETVYTTSDGAQHSSFERATNHAERRYGDALSQLAHTLLQQDKYTKMMTFLDERLEAFAKLQALKADITLVQSGEDD